jgi:hypothetical protein
MVRNRTYMTYMIHDVCATCTHIHDILHVPPAIIYNILNILYIYMDPYVLFYYCHIYAYCGTRVF